MADDVEIQVNQVKQVRSGGDVVEMATVTVADQIAAARFNGRRSQRPRCIRLVMDRRV